MASIKDLIAYLQTLPQDAEVVTTNSYSWASCEVEGVFKEDFGRYLYLKSNPQRNRKPVNHPCLVIHDVKRTDY